MKLWGSGTIRLQACRQMVPVACQAPCSWFSTIPIQYDSNQQDGAPGASGRMSQAGRKQWTDHDRGVRERSTADVWLTVPKARKRAPGALGHRIQAGRKWWQRSGQTDCRLAARWCWCCLKPCSSQPFVVQSSPQTRPRTWSVGAQDPGWQEVVVGAGPRGAACIKALPHLLHRQHPHLGP